MSSKKNRHIGLLGGTFDPIHLTHLHMAEVAKQECGLDEVWFVLNNIPPHKQNQHTASQAHRLTMIEKAIATIPHFELSTVELEREGPSYTVDTLTTLKERYPHDAFYFVIGADMVEYLPQWHDIDRLVQLVSFIGMGRPGSDIEADHPYMDAVQKVDMIPSHLSSTIIRKRKKQKKSIRFLVPEAVYDYIEEWKLYE